MENILKEQTKVQAYMEEPSYSQILFPKKYENLFLAYYLILIPFIVGHIFMFTYISEFNLDIYLDVCSNKNSFFTWCIGYEGFSILFFIALAIYSIKNVFSSIKSPKDSL